jgi:hypothetical protein
LLENTWKIKSIKFTSTDISHGIFETHTLSFMDKGKYYVFQNSDYSYVAKVWIEKNNKVAFERIKADTNNLSSV